jgi:hypothetical protein
VRKNGFELPLSIYQLISCFCFVLSTAASVILIAALCRSPLPAVLVPLNILLFIIVVYNWIYATSVDPAVEVDEITSCFGLSILESKVSRSNSYCVDCNKTVYRMDHHCLFVNNCIGSRNYAYFFCLIVTGTFQMYLHFFVIIFLLITTSHNDHHLGYAEILSRLFFYKLVVLRVLKHALWGWYLIVALQTSVFIFLLTSFFHCC